MKGKEPRRRGIREAIARLFRQRRSAGGMPLDADSLKGLVRGVLSTRDDEIGCEQCFEQLDRFVELILAGKNAAEALPLVHDHLERCADCREEFEALLTILRD